MNNLPILLKELATLCQANALKIATAESCTGGGVAFEITSLAGSSHWFERGFVTYSNLAKIEQLGVSQANIDMYGAVSRVVAMQMAEGALTHSHANLSVAITGIAGPDGGTAQKPVGTCWFAWASPYFETVAIQQQFPSDRQHVRAAAIFYALNYLRDLIKQHCL